MAVAWLILKGIGWLLLVILALLIAALPLGIEQGQDSPAIGECVDDVGRADAASVRHLDGGFRRCRLGHRETEPRHQGKGGQNKEVEASGVHGGKEGLRRCRGSEGVGTLRALRALRVLP